MLDERTRAILTRIHDDYGDNWLEGVLNSLEAWRAEMHLAELECQELSGDNPAAFEALLEQTAGELATVEQDYRALRAYTLALLEAGVEYSLGLAQMSAQLSQSLMLQGGAYVSA